MNHTMGNASAAAEEVAGEQEDEGKLRSKKRPRRSLLGISDFTRVRSEVFKTILFKKELVSRSIFRPF